MAEHYSFYANLRCFFHSALGTVYTENLLIRISLLIIVRHPF